MVPRPRGNSINTTTKQHKTHKLKNLQLKKSTKPATKRKKERKLLQNKTKNTSPYLQAHNQQKTERPNTIIKHAPRDKNTQLKDSDQTLAHPKGTQIHNNSLLSVRTNSRWDHKEINPKPWSIYQYYSNENGAIKLVNSNKNPIIIKQNKTKQNKNRKPKPLNKKSRKP